MINIASGACILYRGPGEQYFGYSKRLESKGGGDVGGLREASTILFFDNIFHEALTNPALQKGVMYCLRGLHRGSCKKKEGEGVEIGNIFIFDSGKGKRARKLRLNFAIVSPFRIF